MLQPEYKEILNTKFVEYKKATKVEATPNFEVEEVVKLSANGNAFIVSKEVKDKQVFYTAKALFGVIYMTGDGIKKTECGVEFSDKIEVNTDTVDLRFIDVCLSDINFDGSKIVATATVKILVLSSNNYSCLVGGSGFETLTEEREYDEYLEQSSNLFTIEDDFDVKYPIKDVLSHTENVFVSSVQCGIGSVIIDGEINLSLFILPLFENGEPIKEKRNIPFRLELENNHALPNMSACGDANIRNVGYKVFADEVKNKSQITVTVQLELSGEAINNVKCLCVKDCYSLTNKIKLDMADVDKYKYMGKVCGSEKVSGVSTGECVENSRLIGVANECVNVINLSNSGDAYTLDLLVSGTAYFKTVDNEYKSVYTEMPATITFESKEQVVDLKVSLTEINARIRNNKIELEAYLKYCYKAFATHKCKYVATVNEGEEKQKNYSAISVYIPKNGDTLWDISKELGETTQSIMEYNKELQFPLKGDERILIYRSLN